MKSRPKELVKVDSTRRISLTAGVLYLITFISIPTLFLYNSVRGANYILGGGPDTKVFVGGTLELIVALAGIGTAVVNTEAQSPSPSGPEPFHSPRAPRPKARTASPQ